MLPETDRSPSGYRRYDAAAVADAPGAGIATAMRSMPTELPEDPTTEQVEAWVELAELVSDPALRARVRQMAVAGASGQQPPAFDAAPVQEHASTAVATGIDPAAPGQPTSWPASASGTSTRAPAKSSRTR